MLLEEKLEGRKAQSLPFLLSRNMNYHTLKNEGFCPNEVIHFIKPHYIYDMVKRNGSVSKVGVTWVTPDEEKG